jgi:hypothetical protein
MPLNDAAQMKTLGMDLLIALFLMAPLIAACNNTETPPAIIQKAEI